MPYNRNNHKEEEEEGKHKKKRETIFPISQMTKLRHREVRE